MRKLRRSVFAALAALCLAASAFAADGVVRARLSSGIDATIYTPDFLLQSLVVTSSTRGMILLDNGVRLDVVTDIDDAIIYNKGDGSFHPFEMGDVMRTLGEIVGDDMSFAVEIYVLPLPRANVLVSSAAGNRIFLSPQVIPVSSSNASYVLAHELGHVFQRRYLPGLDGIEGEDYRRLRGIEDVLRFNAQASHADRPAEIFAEDFRVLRGGPTAHFGGTIENSTIDRPLEVAGLNKFFSSLVTRPTGGPIVELSNYPNPFNPSTEIVVTLDRTVPASGAPVDVRIYDVRGALVKQLHTEPATSEEIRVRWDGRDRNGRDVASGVYFGVVQTAGERKTRKLLLVK